jgi:hypothetical protein
MTQPDQRLQKEIEVVTISPPPQEERVDRRARFYPKNHPRDRYALPEALKSNSPIGYRKRVNFTKDEMTQYMPLLSLTPPKRFVRTTVCEQDLFEETSLGVLSARQSTNFYGQKQRTFGPEVSSKIAELFNGSLGEDRALEEATYTHVSLTRPYRTPFTLLLTFAGHKPFLSLLSVPWRGIKKRFFGATDIPTIAYLRGLHIGIMADGMERAVVIASEGRRKANVILKPFCGKERTKNKVLVDELTKLCKLTPQEKSEGWVVSMVTQVGEVAPEEQLHLEGGRVAWRKLGAAIIALRSERIQPGVNHEPKAPPAYHRRQSMDVSEDLTVQAGRAAYNAFSRWLEIDRDLAKDLLLNDRVDVLTPTGKSRLRKIRRALSDATDCLVRDLPLWIDLPTGRLFSRNANKGRKAFALAGQRIYLMGLSREEIVHNELDWDLALCATGAAAARSALYGELMGCTDVPEGCDMLAGVCLMAGPVNQNDIGKTYYGHPDLLDETLSHRSPTSLLVWTLKAKTVADPVGNEEQLLNAQKKGALVDLRCGPHQVLAIDDGKGNFAHFREEQGQHNQERAFADINNFLTDPDGVEIAGNRGESWPNSEKKLWANT